LLGLSPGPETWFAPASAAASIRAAASSASTVAETLFDAE
jgi:hypothetical protein